jgi:glycosyltransferase involved in cell wall biosynthesis
VNVLLSYYPIPHHAGASGYHQLAPRLRELVPVETVDIGRLPHLPAALRARLVRAAGLEWYDEWELALELRTMQRLLRRPDTLCHVLYGEDAFAHLARARPLIRLRRGRLVASFHQPPAFFERAVHRPRSLQALDAVVALSRQQADYLVAATGNDRVVVVHHGVDTDFFTPRLRDAGRRDGITCLVVGSWLRDFNTLRRVLTALSSAPEIRFELVSPAEDFVDHPNAVVRGRLSDEELRDAYRTADLLVLPLLDSTANNSLLEGLACGLPIITTDVGGVAEYVDTGSAVLVEPHDADAICEAVTALAADRERRQELGRSARERALELDWSRVAERVRDVYEEIA